MATDKYSYLGPGVRPAVRKAISELRQTIVAEPGTEFYVDGDTGASGGDGKNWDDAYDTIQCAVDVCGDGTGDAIYYCRRGNTLHCAPTPEQENLLDVWHSNFPTKVSDTSVEIDFANYDTFITSTAIQLCWAYREEGENVDMISKIAQITASPFAADSQLRAQLERGLEIMKE